MHCKKPVFVTKPHQNQDDFEEIYMSGKKSKKKWTKPRHHVVTFLLRYTLGIYTRLKYNIKVDKFKEQQKRPYLILLNHQTAFDQFFVGLAFKGPLYYLASEDLFSKGFVSSLIKFLVEPIPIKKQTTDIRAILNCIKVSKEGGTIVIAPEGHRTYSGKTVYMSPSIVMLARKLNVPILLFRIEGGYGVHPRWSDVVRRGKMRGYISRVIYPEEYKEMSDDELFTVISEGLYVNEATNDGEYRHAKLAEYLERAMYVCPYCGLSEFESHGDIIECKKCRRQIKYLPNKKLEGVGFDFPYEFVSDWYDYQKDFVNNLDVTAMTDSPIYTDTGRFSEEIVYQKKLLLHKNVNISLYGDKIIITAEDKETYYLPFGEISTLTVLGKNKLNIYYKDHIYQVKGGKRFNALKYVNIFFRHKNITKGDKNDTFLGL